ECPEGEGIAAYLSISLQCSNVIAFVYVLVQNYRPISHSISISVLLFLSILVAVLLAIFWQGTAIIGGVSHRFKKLLPSSSLLTRCLKSLSLMILMFFAGTVGCCSVVMFFPFTSLFRKHLTSALSTGMGRVTFEMVFYL